VFSETRLTRLMNYAKSRKRYCPEHDGVPVEVTSLETDERDPRQVSVHYVCRRGRWPAKTRTHSGTIRENLMALEVDMLAEANRPTS
jgi:hypothetical protein